MNSPSLIILLFAFATAFVIKHLRFEAGRKRLAIIIIMYILNLIHGKENAMWY